jgi:hypothetical protein
MRSFALAVLLLAAPAIASARPDEHGKKVRRGHTPVVETVEAPRTAHRPGVSDVYFTPGRVQVIREYYGPQYRSLPPGLQKKLYRTGQLPPGWQKKVRPFPVVVERRLGPLPSYYRRGVIDNYAVVYDPRRNAIIDVAPLW